MLYKNKKIKIYYKEMKYLIYSNTFKILKLYKKIQNFIIKKEMILLLKNELN
jgi:hypothetical protein